MGYRIIRKYIVVTLLKDQYACTVLSTVILAKAKATHIKSQDSLW